MDPHEHLQERDDLAWHFEIDMENPEGSTTVSSKQIEEMDFLATNAKKQRTEVKLSQLSPSEQAEFSKAKEAEISNWLSTGTVCRILRNKLPAEQILRCRWIYTWKPIEGKEEQAKAGKDKKVKARLVVLGYLDPALEDIPRDSPTLGRQ